MFRINFLLFMLVGWLSINCSSEQTKVQPPRDEPQRGLEQAKPFPIRPGSSLTTENWILVAQAAERTVAGTVKDIHSYYGKNEHGFDLILSDVKVDVSSVLKGEQAKDLSFTMEGGTIGDTTLSVSSVMPLKKGATYVFLLSSDQEGRLRLFGTNFGALPLEKDARVQALNTDLIKLQQAIRR